MLVWSNQASIQWCSSLRFTHNGSHEHHSSCHHWSHDSFWVEIALCRSNALNVVQALLAIGARIRTNTLVQRTNVMHPSCISLVDPAWLPSFQGPSNPEHQVDQAEDLGTVDCTGQVNVHHCMLCVGIVNASRFPPRHLWPEAFTSKCARIAGQAVSF